MADPIKIFTTAHVPPELGKAWLQHLRDFDVAHPGCHFEVGIDAPHLPLEVVVEFIRLNPGLDFETVYSLMK